MYNKINSKKSKKNVNSNNNSKIDLQKEYDDYIRYLLDDYGSEMILEAQDGNKKGYKCFKREIKCMANKCKDDIINYLEADILASEERKNKCESFYDSRYSKCLRKIKTKYKPNDKFAKMIHCKTNKCITKKQMQANTQAYLDSSKKHQCMLKNCDKAVSDYRARKIHASNEIEWQCNKDNQTRYKQMQCQKQTKKNWFRANRDKQLVIASDKCFRNHCITNDFN